MDLDDLRQISQRNSPEKDDAHDADSQTGSIAPRLINFLINGKRATFRCTNKVTNSSRIDVRLLLLPLPFACNQLTCRKNSMAASSSSFHNEVVEIVPHRFEGVFIAKGKEEDALCTKNLVPGEALYDEELISVQIEDGIEVEFRVWNPVRSKLASAILSGLNNIWTKPGSRVLCLGDVCGTTVSHLSDLVGPDGLVYAVGLSETVVNMLEKRSNVLPIMENTACTWKYRMIMGMVDVMYAHAAYCHEETIVAMNAEHYLKSGGHFLISTQGKHIASTSHGEAMFTSLGRDRKREFKPLQLVPLKPLERDLTYVVGGVFRMPE